LSKSGPAFRRIIRSGTRGVWRIRREVLPGELPVETGRRQDGLRRLAGQVIGGQDSGTWLELFREIPRLPFDSRDSTTELPDSAWLRWHLPALPLVAGAWPMNTAFRIVRYANWRGVNYDLHRVGGALMLGFVVLSGITGGYFTWPSTYRSIAASILPTKPSPKAPPVRTAGTRVPLDELVASAQRALPGTKLVRVLVPRRG
jgi:hypothetical protein